MAQKEISNTEWGLVMGAAATVDAAQVMLDVILLGGLNPFIDLIAGMSLTFYCWMRGIRLDWKKGGSLGLTWLMETFGVQTFDALPLWTADVAVIMAFYKADHRKQEVQELTPEDKK